MAHARQLVVFQVLVSLEKRDRRSTQLPIHLFLRPDYYRDCKSLIRNVLMAIARRRAYSFRSTERSRRTDSYFSAAVRNEACKAD
jgi:hypothetical protein